MRQNPHSRFGAHPDYTEKTLAPMNDQQSQPRLAFAHSIHRNEQSHPVLSNNLVGNGKTHTRIVFEPIQQLFTHRC